MLSGRQARRISGSGTSSWIARWSSRLRRSAEGLLCGPQTLLPNGVCSTISESRRSALICRSVQRWHQLEVLTNPKYSLARLISGCEPPVSFCSAPREWRARTIRHRRQLHHRRPARHPLPLQQARQAPQHHHAIALASRESARCRCRTPIHSPARTYRSRRTRR
jgi:hypothetical protein